MSVEVGNLSFVSTLDNSDFQEKSLQDLKLIQLRLQLTGDTTAIDKYNEAVTAQLNTEAALRKQLNDILAEAKVKIQELPELAPPKTDFGDSVAEVQAYMDALRGLESGAGIVADLNAQLDELVVKTEALNEQLAAGAISEADYADQMLAINAEQQRLIANIQQVNDSFAENILIQNENTQVIQKTTVAVEEEIGILEELKITLAELKANQLTIVDPVALARNNKALQETEAEINRFKNVGKVGFDELGNEIEQTTVKTGRFQAAIGRATSLDALGGRIVQQFTRQIIGLGVGFISLEIGAKAIQSLIEYIQNLDIFTGRLDQAKQNLIAFNEIMSEADKTAGPQLASLKLLYDQTQNVNLALKERVSAAEQLRDLYPAEFQNASALAIVNGKLTTSYNDLANSIIAVAKSQAAQSKIGTLETTVQDQQFLIDKNNLEKAKLIVAAKQQFAKQVDDLITARKNGDVNSPDLTADVLKTRIASISQSFDFQNLTPTQTIKVAQGQIDYLTQFVGNVTKSATALQKANELLGVNLQNFDNLLNGSKDKTQLENIKNALQVKLDSLAPGDAQIENLRAKIQKVDDLIKNTYTVKASTGKQDPAIALLASQTTVLQNIDALKTKYAAKEKTRDEQQQADLIANYTKEYNAAVAFNTKLAQFRKDHPNDQSPSAEKLKPINPQSILDNENSALAGLRGTQSVEATVQATEKQKAIFKEYEAFKLQAGTEAANKLFANDIQGYTSYIAYLKSLTPTETDLTSADPYTKARASALQDYLKKALPEAQNQELELQQKHLQQLIIQDQDWQQKRATLIATSNEAITLLTSKGFKDQAEQEKQNLADQLTALDINGFETQAKYKKLFSDINELSSESAKTLIKNAEAQAAAELATGQITVDAYKKITEALSRLGAAIDNRKFDELATLGSSLTTIGQSLSGVNGNISTWVSQLGSLASGLANVGKQYEQIAADAGDATKQTQDYISLAATGISALFSIISSISSAAATRKQQATDYYNSVIAFQNEYNLALIQQEQIQYQTAQGSIFGTNYAEQLADGAKAYKDASKDLQASEQALSQGQAIVGQKNVINGGTVAKDAVSGAVAGAVIAGPVGAAVGGVVGALAGLFGGKTKQNVLKPLLDIYPQLIDANGKFNESLAKTLIANNQVSDSTKVLLQNTIGYYDEEKAALDQITQALQSLVGDLGTTLSDNLTQAFENGSDAALAFEKTVSQVLGNIVQQDLFQAVFGDQLAALQKKLTADSLNNDGQTQAEIIADIENFYKTAGPLVTEFTNGLQSAQQAAATAGIPLFPSGSTGTSTGLSGQITASITEDTASKLAGAMNGIQLNTLTTNNILQGHSLSFGQLVGLAQDQLQAALAIQQNTLRTADNTDLMIASLDAIAQNTKSSVGDQLRAAGKLGY